MKIYSIDQTNSDNFTSVAPTNLLCELSLSHQYAFGAIVSEAEKAAGEKFTITEDHELKATDHAAGMIIYYVNPKSRDVIVKWIYVADEFEGEGIGTALIEEVERTARAVGSDRIRISLPGVEYNPALEDYFLDHGFVDTGNRGRGYFCSILDIADNPMLSSRPLSKKVVSMKNASLSKLRSYITENMEIFKDTLAIEPADLIVDIESVLCDPEINCEYIDTDGKVSGCLIIVNNSQDSVSPIFLCSSSTNKGPQFIDMIRFSAEQARKKYGDNLEVRIKSVSKESQVITNALFEEDAHIEYSEYCLSL